MHRFFLPPKSFSSDQITFPDDIAHQIRRVLRLNEGDRVLTLDGQNNEMLVELTDISDSAVTGKIISCQKNSAESAVRVTVLVALTQREKFEWILQKCTELGAAGIMPLVTSRSLVQDVQKVSSKIERWQNIIREAAEQSGRGKVPLLHAPLKFKEALSTAAAENDLLLMPWENEDGLTLKDRLSQKEARQAHKIAILIGPEGGFSYEEARQAQQAGFETLSLGPRILRMETAAMITLAFVLYDLDQMM